MLFVVLIVEPICIANVVSCFVPAICCVARVARSSVPCVSATARLTLQCVPALDHVTRCVPVLAFVAHVRRRSWSFLLVDLG